jgi:hypothetical protein
LLTSSLEPLPRYWITACPHGFGGERRRVLHPPFAFFQAESFHDAKSQMNSLRGVDHLYRFERDMSTVQVLE